MGTGALVERLESGRLVETALVETELAVESLESGLVVESELGVGSELVVESELGDCSEDSSDGRRS